MLSVFLTLCGIVAVIWWLTGSSRGQTEAREPSVDVGLAEEAVQAVAPQIQGTGAEERAGEVVYDLLTSVGMASDDAAGTVRSLGLSVVKPESHDASQGLSVFSLKEERSRAALERALLVGVELARMDDDYAGVSDDVVAFASLRRQADDVETKLFDERRRSQFDFYSRAVLVLQDRMQSTVDPDKKALIRELLTRFDAELVTLQEEMTRSMARLPDEGDLAWGDSEDRRRYYFKMGVTNSLRRSGVLKSLGHLYRLRGVNYNVEEAFQLAGQEEPILLRAAGLDFTTLVALRPADVRSMTTERGLNRPTRDQKVDP